jgi:hypothetical protein
MKLDQVPERRILLVSAFQRYKIWGIKLVTQRPLVYENGFFGYTNGPQYWLSCMRLYPGGVPGTVKAYRIYAPTPENLKRPECEQIKLSTIPVPDKSQGAYRYI